MKKYQQPWPLRLVKTDYHSQPGTHYTTNEIMGDAMIILRDLEPDDLNWVFLSTSGVHGSYASLDDAAKALPEPSQITVLIVMPRMVTTMFGHALVSSAEDIALLRQRVEQTIVGVQKLQDKNRRK